MEPLKFKEIQEGMEDPSDFSAQLATFGDNMIRNGMRKRKKAKPKSPVIPQETTEGAVAPEGAIAPEGAVATEGEASNANAAENVAPNENMASQEQQDRGNPPNESPIPQEQQREVENRPTKEGMQWFEKRMGDDIKSTRTSLSEVRGRNAKTPYYEQWKTEKARLYGRNPEDEETKKAFRYFEDLSDTFPARLERQKKRDLFRAMNPEERYNKYKDMTENLITRIRDNGMRDPGTIIAGVLKLYENGMPFKAAEQEFRKAGLLNSENEREFYDAIDRLYAPMEIYGRKDNERFLKEIIENPFKEIPTENYRKTPLLKRFKRFMTGKSSDFLTRKLQEAEKYRDRPRASKKGVNEFETIEELPQGNPVIPQEVRRPSPRPILQLDGRRMVKKIKMPPALPRDTVVPILNASEEL